MTTQIRPQVRRAIDSAVAAGIQPKAGRNGVGLSLAIPGARFRLLYNQNGILPAGKYYYEKTGIPTPGQFDYTQDAERRGRSNYIKLLDGSQKKVSTWDNINRSWKLTAMGKLFYSRAVDKYTVLWPVKIQLTRVDGSIYEREDWLPSTAIPELGEIEVPRSLPENEQRQQVAQKELAWRQQQPVAQDGNRILIAGYETHMTDVSDARRVQFNKLSVNTQGDVEAVLHRPLREGSPWSFHGLEGASEESLENTQDQCVSYQLSHYIRVKGQAQFTQECIADMLTTITEEMYPDEEELRDPNVGYTTAAILRLCKDLCVPIHIKWGKHKIQSFTPEKPLHETMALYIWGDHCFTVSDVAVKRSIVREPTTEPSPQEKCLLGKIGRMNNTAPASQYWDTYSILKPGHFKSSDLMAIRGALLREHVCPQVVLGGMGNLKTLRYNDCFIHNWPHEAHVCLKFLEEYSKIRHHSLAYRGESLSTFCQMIFDDLSRQTDRPFITRDIKQELAGRQKNQCAVCGDCLVQEIDHKIPRGASCHGSDDISNFHFLCITCHREKTQQDHQRMNVEDPNAYMSRFSAETWEGFVMSRRPTQMVCNLHDALPRLQCMEVDVKSCRLAGVVEANVHRIPIFSPLDEFQKPTEGAIADYSWVDIGTVRSPLGSYIYDGPRWYDTATVKFMLAYKVCKWHHILLVFNATAHRPPEDLAAKLRKMRSVWHDVGGSKQGEAWAGQKAKKKDCKELLAKTSLLGLLGAWGRTENYRHSLVTTSHPDDIPWSGLCTSRPTPFSETTETGFVFNDITWKQQILNLGSFLPLNLIGRSQERLQVASALAILKRCTELRHVLSIQVDALYIQAPKRDFQKLEVTFKGLRYCHLHKSPYPKALAMGDTPRIQKSLKITSLSSTHLHQEPCKSTELVYRVKTCEPRFPGGKLKIATHTEPPYPKLLEWDTQTESKRGPDDFLQRILDHVSADKSFTCIGCPGTGKTWILAKVKEHLEALGKKVACIAPTHAGARLLPEGDTIHHFVGKFAMLGAFQGWLLLDEISMGCLPLFAALDQLRLGGTKIATFGDFQQLPPHPESNSWRGEHICAEAFQESRLYKTWSDCTRFELTRCRRSDREHFDFYTTLPDNLPKAIQKAKKQYTKPENVTHADLHICISHWRRRKISMAKQVEAAEGKACVNIPDGEDPGYPCFVGTRVVGNSTNNKFVNGGRYVVTAMSEEKILLQDESNGVSFETTPEAVSKYAILAWALTYQKVQGTTEKGIVFLHDLGSRHLKRCHLYVGLSRVTSGKHVFIDNC